MLSRATETTLMRKFSGRAGYITLIIPAFITIALFYILLYSVFLPGFEKNVWLRKREGIREIVYSGWSVLNHYHTLEEKGELTREEAQRQARELIKSMRYGRDFKDYYWITGMDSTLVLHPYRPDLEGKYVLQNTDQSVRNVFITFVDVVKKDGEGFSEYSWQWKDDPGRMEQKLSYVKKFEPWDWIIGSGLYINDVRNDIEAMESRIKRISLFIFSLVLIFISSIIHQNLKANRERLCNVEALLRSEERFRETVDLLPEIVFETDENGTISFVNQFAYFATGYNRLDVEQGFNALDFIEPQDRQRAFANIQSVKEGKVLGVVEYSARRKDGSLFPVLVRSVPIINNGHVTGLRGIIVDITERKQAEKTLAEKEEKYRQLFEMESDAIFLIENATGKISEVNQAASELYGYTRDELRSMKNTNLSAEVSKTIAATLGHEERIPVRMHRKKDGTVFPVEIAARHFILHGKEMHIAAIRDITERIAAKELLEKQWLFLKNVIDNAPNSIYVLDSRCNVVLANKHFAELFGISPEEMIGKNPIDFIRDTTIAKKFRDDEEMIFQGKKPYITIEHTIIDNNGSRRRLYTNKVPLVGASGAVEYLLGISSDITVLLETEEALRKSEDRLGTIFSIATDAIFIKNKSFVYTDVNPAFSTLFNKSIEACIGKTDFDFFSTEEASRIRSVDERVLQGETIEEEHDFFINNEVRSFSAIKVPMRDKTGEIIALIGIARDITERKRLESQFIQAQKMESIGRLAGGIAHDFNNILTVIIGNVDFAMLSLNENDPITTDLVEIKNNAERAANLTRQLLAFSRQQIIEPKIIDLNSVVAEMDKMLRRIIGEQIELETNLKKDLWMVNIDPGQIQQILTNLVVNSRDALTPGKGSITVETDNVFLDENYVKAHGGASAGDYVMLAVSDNGVGMDEVTKAHIFEPFYTTKDVGKGTGLGLATCYGIVKQNNGSIWVYSELGEGTTVKIYLPRHIGEDVSPVGMAAMNELPGGTETLLLVEDEASLKNLAVKLLKSKGYTVHDASDGEQALKVIDQIDAAHIDLLITDVVMPKMGGVELAQRLKDKAPSLRVLFMSGYTDSTIVSQGILEHNVEYLQKPFTPISFLNKIRTVLDKG